MKCRQQVLVNFWGAGIRKALHDLKEDLLHDDKDDHPQISQHPHTSVQPQIIEQPHHMSHHPHTSCDQPHITSGYVYAPVSLIEQDKYVRSFSFPPLQHFFSFFKISVGFLRQTHIRMLHLRILFGALVSK